MSQKIQPDDLFRLQFLKEAELSPDGNLIAYTVANYVETENKKKEERVTIWIYVLKDKTSYQLTGGNAIDNNPRWSPDSKTIAFLSTREKKSQIFLINISGGEAKKLTTLEQGVESAPVWSPDGSKIAFSTKKKDKSDPKEPYRISRHIYRFDALGNVDTLVHDIYVVDITDSKVEQVTDDVFHNTFPRWSNDGQEILFTSCFDPDSHSSSPYMVNIKKFLLTRDKIKNILIGWNVFVADWHPNGYDVIFIGQPKGRPIGSKNDLWIINKDGEEPRCLTESLNYGIGGNLQADMPIIEWSMPKFLFHKNGKYCYQMVQKGGNVEVYKIPLEGNEQITRVVGGERSCIPMGISIDNLLFAVSMINSPGELFLANIDGSKEEQLTTLNDIFLAEKYLPEIDHLLFQGTDDIDVEGWFLNPPGEPPFPTVLYIHGGPHSGFGNVFSFDFQMLVGAGYGVLYINQRGSTGYGDDFATKIIGDWGNHDFTDLMAGVDFAIKKGLADPNKLGVCGLSGGGNLTCWIIGQTDRFKAAIPENPVTNWVSFYGISDIGVWFAVEELGGHPHEIPDIYSKCSPITYAHKCTTPTLLIQGVNDHRCPPEQSEQYYTVLKANGCIVEMLRLPESFHAGSIRGSPNIRKAQNEGLLAWLQKYALSTE